MRHRARVLADSTSTAWVEIEGVSACQRCENGQGCGAGIFARGVKSVQIECKTALQVKKNQQVIVEFDEAGSQWLWLVAGAYGLPTVSMIGATILASLLIPATQLDGAAMIAWQSRWAEALIAGCALLGLAGGVFAWRCMAPHALARLEMGLCLHSARIVTVNSVSLGEL